MKCIYDWNCDNLKRLSAVKQVLFDNFQGNQLFKEGKYEAAINRYTKAISLHAYNPILYANRGMALIKTEKLVIQGFCFLYL